MTFWASQGKAVGKSDRKGVVIEARWRMNAGESTSSLEGKHNSLGNPFSRVLVNHRNTWALWFQVDSSMPYPSISSTGVNSKMRTGH